MESVKDAERVIEALDLLEEEKIQWAEYEKGKLHNDNDNDNDNDNTNDNCNYIK